MTGVLMCSRAVELDSYVYYNNRVALIIQVGIPLPIKKAFHYAPHAHAIGVL